MFHASWPTALCTRRIRWIALIRCIAALVMALSAVTAGMWVFRHTPDRPADRRDPNCQKFHDMLKDSSDAAGSIYTRFDNKAGVYEGDFILWASTMQHDAAQITGPGDLAQVAGQLADD